MSEHPSVSRRRTPWRTSVVLRSAVTIATVALVATIAGCGGGGDSGVSAGPRRQSFPVTLGGLEGGRVTLSRPGKPSVVAFAANWCAPCRLELPELERLYQERGSEVTFVAVGVEEEPEQTRQLVADTAITFPVAVDPDGKALAAAGIPGLPGTVILDREGRIAARLTGKQTAASVSDALAEVD